MLAIQSCHETAALEFAFCGHAQAESGGEFCAESWGKKKHLRRQHSSVKSKIHPEFS
jgi:hypothetical protein